MISASELKSRINSITDTKKITDAMHMISSAKVRRAIRDLEETTPYFTALREKIGELFYHFPETESRYFRVPPPEDSPHKNHGIVLITSDKGLAGAYNSSAIKLCLEYMQRHPRTTLFIIGEYGRQYFKKEKIPFVEDFLYSGSHPVLLDARKIAADLMEYFDDRKLDEINIIYTDYIGAKPGICKKITVLPLEQTHFPHESEKSVYREFLPSPDVVLDEVIPSYIMGFLYGCLVESFCSEQQARMMSMKSASDNADKILKDLKIQYNKVRQSAITGEITEISAGAKAQKNKSEIRRNSYDRK